MPRNGSGVMSKPPNTTAQPNTTIRSAMFNSVIDDLIQDANNARPITAGGTGAQTIEAMRSAFEIDRKTVFATKSADYTLVKDDNNAAISVSATATMALAAASTLGMSWHALIIADGGTATIDPTGSEKINGAATLVLQDGQAAFVIATGITGDEFSAIVFSSGQLPYVEKSANYTALASDNRSTLYFTAGATLSLTAAATMGSDWRMRVVAGGGQVTIDPNGSELVNGVQTLVLQQGQEAYLIGTGAAFRALVSSDARSGPQLQGYTVGLGLSTNATDPAKDVDVAVGAAASDALPYYFMQLTSPLTKRLDAAWAVGNNQGGLDTGTVSAAGTYYIWLIQRSDTQATDVLFSLSPTAPTMPTNYDRKRLLGSLVRAASVNGAPAMASYSDLGTWVCLNGTGTIAIRDSQGVSSLVDLGTGRYQANLSSPKPNSNYAVSVTGLLANPTQMVNGCVEAVTTTSVAVRLTSKNIGVNDDSLADLTYVSIMIASH